jgi:outer membrane protein OmpA-like peptidoglycan-associated protein
MLKRLTMLGAAMLLLALAACDGTRTVAQTPTGGRVVECQTPVVGYRSTSPCYDGTNITRYVKDDTRDITPKRSDNGRDITDRRNRDDVRDRSVYCVDVGAMIVAPSFIVFFDFDRSDLTAVALDTIGRAADAYKSTGGARVTATGHTDRAGPADYNMALSLRRASAVKAQLVREGVKDTDISVVGLGETSPMVPTPDGVREAQNRRVEIVIR